MVAITRTQRNKSSGASVNGHLYTIDTSGLRTRYDTSIKRTSICNDNNIAPTGAHHFVGDTSWLSCEPRGIPQKGLQIACVVAIYVNDVIRKFA